MVVALPLVLPPTVLGFYLLLLLGPHGAVGQFTQQLGWGSLAFTFYGLLIGSILYSLPFVVQPLQTIPGSEYADVVRAAKSVQKAQPQARIAVGAPLLATPESVVTYPKSSETGE